MIFSRCSFVLMLLLLAATGTSSAQTQSPKRELRAAWIATVSNIDWPSRPGLSAQEQQAQFIRRLDQLKAVGCNAVIVQVRPTADAFYSSSYEPWSRFLSGKTGAHPGYEPLQFMIEETHKRCMEFHAWFNPFRALTDSKKNPNPETHVTRSHPEWIIHYGGKSYLNPAIPEARKYVIDVINEVVQRYDIDAVHLDDYFYPYPVAGVQFPDNSSWLKYGGSFSNKADWRRNNVNLFVEALAKQIKQAKAHVKFGISPFGVWRSDAKDPDGSAVRGALTNYDDLFADVRLWLERGWIDYAMPQLYWEHYHRAAAFEVLLPWWINHTYERHVYYGLGLYRMVNTYKGPWASTAELLWQIRDIRKSAKSSGFALYSSSNFDKIALSIEDSLAALNTLHALPPRMKWIDSVSLPAPSVLAATTPNGTQLNITQPEGAKDFRCFAIYRFYPNEPVDLERTDRLLTLTRNNTYVDIAGKDKKYVYIVTALDKLWNESAAGKPAISAP